MACWPVGPLGTGRRRAMKKYRVTLTAAERDELEQLLARGKADVRRLKHAQVLLKADQAEGGPAWPDERIVAALDVGIATVRRLRQRFVLEGLQAALIPTASGGDWFGPFAAGDGGDAIWHGHERVPGLAAGFDDGL